MAESKARLISAAFTSTGDIKSDNLDNVSAGFDSADVLTISAPLSNRNLIINGAMQVWQRGTSLSITTSDFRIADRWINFPGTDGGGTASQQAFTLGQTDVPGEPEYYLRHDQSTGASSAPNVQTRLEDVRTGAGQSVTLSFYARVTSGTLTIDPIIRQNFGSGGSSYVDNTPDDITVTTSWQRFTRTITLASISGKTIGSNNQIQIRLELPTSTTFTLDIALAQFEIGSVATPFEHRSYGKELALCQRYLYRTSGGPDATNAPNHLGPGFAYTGTNLGHVSVHFPQTMRAKPTFSFSGISAWNGTSYPITSIITNNSSLQVGTLNLGVASGLTTTRGYSILSPSTGAGYIQFDAEL